MLNLKHNNPHYYKIQIYQHTEINKQIIEGKKKRETKREIKEKQKRKKIKIKQIKKEKQHTNTVLIY